METFIPLTKYDSDLTAITNTGLMFVNILRHIYAIDR